LGFNSYVSGSDVLSINLSTLILLGAYRKHFAEHGAEYFPPKLLHLEQIVGLVGLIKAPPAGG
tara:strand:+ start:11064 stop:11252 length:189 start_codon:yes stop_codon:yes gene_type:complete